MKRKSQRISALIAVGFVLIAAASAIERRPVLLYNPSPSAPRGLYVVRPSATAERGDLVAARLPEWARELASERGYLPSGLPVIKTVWAVAGDRVCAENGSLRVAGRPALIALESDRAGRTMPRWSECRTLQNGEVFLASTQVDESFDGRYFGPVSATNILGRAVRVWPREGTQRP